MPFPDPYDGQRPGLSPEMQRIVFGSVLVILVVLASLLIF